MEMSPTDLKAALASWASGIAVVSTELNGIADGITVSSFTSLSLDPPLVLACLGSGSRLLPAIRQSGRFAVSVLAADQEEASRHFATRGRNRAEGASNGSVGRQPGGMPTDPDAGFGTVPVVRTPDGQPRVGGAAAWLACTLEALLPQGDHHVVIGRVTAAGADEGRLPLLYFRRAYRAVADR